MEITQRPATTSDAQACGRICFDAFARIAAQHNFPSDWPSVEGTVDFLAGLIAHPGFYGVVAELGGRVVGSNFLDERATVAGLGPITVDPDVQNSRIGRGLMEHALARTRAAGRPSVRLVQAAFHGRSLSLYARLGFGVCEPLSCMQGAPLGVAVAGHAVRQATSGDLPACGDLCLRVHGFERTAEVADAISAGTATVVEHNGVVSGYATMIGFGGHAVARDNLDLKALIGAAQAFGGPGFLLPSRNSDLFRWCLERGLRIVQPMTYMSMGLYNEPQGAWLPSILL